MRKKSKSWKKIHICGFEWKWKFGNTIVLRDPENKVYQIPLTEICGWTWDEIERGQWKGYLSIKPSQVKDYILKTFDTLIFERKS